MDRLSYVSESLRKKYFGSYILISYRLQKETTISRALASRMGSIITSRRYHIPLSTTSSDTKKKACKMFLLQANRLDKQDLIIAACRVGLIEPSRAKRR
jgi:hypothetical protein